MTRCHYDCVQKVLHAHQPRNTTLFPLKLILMIYGSVQIPFAMNGQNQTTFDLIVTHWVRSHSRSNTTVATNVKIVKRMLATAYIQNSDAMNNRVCCPTLLLS